MNAPAPSTYREVVDDNGRVYRIGETDRDILGRSRVWMVWMPWLAMMAAGCDSETVSGQRFVATSVKLSGARGRPRGVTQRPSGCC